jgi:hypothetical protein
MNQKTIFWIDDLHDDAKLPCANARRTFEEILQCKLVDRRINNNDEYNQAVVDVDKIKPYAVIIDYQLTRVGKEGRTLYGTTLAAEIRANHPLIPIVGVTTMLPSDTPHFRLENYIYIFDRSALTGSKHNYFELKALLDGFHSIRAIRHGKGINPVNGLLHQLHVPFRDDSSDYLLLCDSLPRFVQDNTWDSETPHAFSRWMWNDFTRLPGLLIDDLDAATLLGLSTKGFNLITDQFSECLYNGVFSVQSKRRWWAGKFLETVEKLLHRHVIFSMAEEREELLFACKIPVKSEYLSRPFGYNGEMNKPAEIVAYLDGNRDETKRIQCLISDSHTDPLDKGLPLGFTPRRIFNGK